MEGKVGGRSSARKELVMYGDLDVIASARCCVDSSSVENVVVCGVASVLKEMMWSADDGLEGGPTSSPTNLQGYQNDYSCIQQR